MANSGSTTTAALADSLPSIRQEARTVREYEGVMPQVVDKKTLGEGIGLDWNEITYAQLTAQAVTETTELDNPQQISDTLTTITPTVVGIETLITDRVMKRIAKVGVGKIGGLAQKAIQRKKDEDGLIVLDGATTSLCGAGSTLTSGHISAAVTRISSNATEPGNPPYRAVLHGYQIKDIEDEIVAGVGTYPIGEGLTARVFAEGFRGMVGGAQLYEDGNIAIDGDADSKGGVFAMEGIVMVQGRKPWILTKERPEIGGGATSVYHYDEYAYGERSAGNWLFEIRNGLPPAKVGGQYGVNCGNSKGNAYDNPQPSVVNDIEVAMKVHRLEVEESTNKTSNSAPHPDLGEEIVEAQTKVWGNLLQRCYRSN